MEHPGDIRTHPLEDCPVCQELGDWASCEDSVEWLTAHSQLQKIKALHEVVDGPR